MIYEFEDIQSGQVIEQSYSMREVPSVGTELVIDGRMCRRILSRSVRLNSEQIANVAHNYPYESRSMPHFDPSIAKTSPDGFTVVRDRAHERNLMAMTGRVRD